MRSKAHGTKGKGIRHTTRSDKTVVAIKRAIRTAVDSVKVVLMLIGAYAVFWYLVLR